MTWEYELENKNVNDSMNTFYHTVVNAYNRSFRHSLLLNYHVKGLKTSPGLQLE